MRQDGETEVNPERGKELKEAEVRTEKDQLIRHREELAEQIRWIDVMIRHFRTRSQDLKKEKERLTLQLEALGNRFWDE